MKPNSIQPIFLEGSAYEIPVLSPPSYKLTKPCRDGDHSLPPSTSMKRRAQALILFVGYALKPEISFSSEGGSISAVITHLTTLATLTGGETTDTNIDEISEAARSSIHRLLSGMSVAIFIESVESMLKSGDAEVYEFFSRVYIMPHLRVILGSSRCTGAA